MNMINLTSGTRGFLHQIAGKIIFNKNITSIIKKKSFNDNDLNNFCQKNVTKILNNSLPTRIIDSLRCPLDEIELNLFNITFKKNFQSIELELGFRCLIERKLFHSLNYKLKGKINSYSVCYQSNSKRHYGDIVKFIRYDGKIYAFIKKYHIDNSDCLESMPLLPGSESHKQNLFVDRLKVYFFKFYHCFKEDSSILKFVPIDKIVCKCLIVNSENFSFFTELSYEFEHD